MLPAGKQGGAGMLQDSRGLWRTMRVGMARRAGRAGHARALNAIAGPPSVQERGITNMHLYQLSAGSLAVGVESLATALRPGNGGLRVYTYPNVQDAMDECAALTAAMADKHAVYNTGFAGAKLVLKCNEGVDAVDKAQLMQEVAAVLQDETHAGQLFTGCDVNTSGEDMELLSELCPYVLASIGCPTDANDATAHGVYSSVMAMLEHLRALEHPTTSGSNPPTQHGGKSALVMGCGKVGATVARLLLAAKVTVYTSDVFPDRADIPGATNISGQDWAAFDCDVLVPCATSRFIDEGMVARMRCAAVVGSANVPFASPAALAAAEARQIAFVPESVTSAGAVLADSIEHYATEAYKAARPSLVYAYIRWLVHGKTQELLNLATQRRMPPSRLVNAVKSDPATLPPVGRRFSTWVETVTESYDTVVIGGGMAGTSAAYWLSRLAPDMKGLVVESGPGIAHAGGSSHGASRMYRQMYSSNYFSAMQEAAMPMWREIEAQSGRTLLKENGLLFYGETDTGETVEGSIPDSKRVMQERGIAHEHLTGPEQLGAHYPHMVAKEAHEGLLEHAAGSINASAACESMMALAQSSGNWQVAANTRVDDVFVAEPGKVVIVTSAGKVLQASKVVLAAGAWTNDLLAHLGGKMDLEVWRVHWGHYEVDPEVAQKLPQWFHFAKEAPDGWDGGLYYGFPAEDKDVPVVKIGVDFTPPPHRSTSMEGFDYSADPKVAALIDDFLAQRWKGFVKARDMQSSPYAMTADSKFVLDKLPWAPEVTVFTGGSGRAFKFAPLLGHCVADLVLGNKPVYDIAPLAITRPEAKLQRIPVATAGTLPHVAMKGMQQQQQDGGKQVAGSAR